MWVFVLIEVSPHVTPFLRTVLEALNMEAILPPLTSRGVLCLHLVTLICGILVIWCVDYVLYRYGISRQKI